MPRGPNRPLRIVPEHVHDDVVFVEVIAHGRKVGHVRIESPRKLMPPQAADILVRKIQDLNRLVQLAVTRLESTGPTKEFDDG